MQCNNLQEESSPSHERSYRDLVGTQMAILCKNEEGTETGQQSRQNNCQFTLKTAINQKRIVVVKLPYSDMNNLPPQVSTIPL